MGLNISVFFMRFTSRFISNYFLLIFTTIIYLLFMSFGHLAYAAEEQQGDKSSVISGKNRSAQGTSGLPIPRFVSLKAKEVNMRQGPGRQYKIIWKYVRKWYPVEVIAEYNAWRKVVDIGGEEGWIHKSLLSGKRTAILIEEKMVWRRTPNDDANKVLISNSGVIAEIEECRSGWCRLQYNDYRGWVPVHALWGVSHSTIRDN